MRILLLCALGMSPAFANAKDPVFLSIQEVEKQWSGQEFKSEAFKTSDCSERAKMAADLIKKKRFVGESRESVEKELGPTTEHFLKGEQPAYLLDGQDGNVLQLVVVLNSKNMVERLQVHRKYCSDTPPPPPLPPVAKLVSKDKKLGIEVTGEVAKAMWDHMAELNGDKGEKKGDSARCTKSGHGENEKYKCSFSFDEDGVIESR